MDVQKSNNSNNTEYTAENEELFNLPMNDQPINLDSSPIEENVELDTTERESEVLKDSTKEIQHEAAEYKEDVSQNIEQTGKEDVPKNMDIAEDKINTTLEKKVEPEAAAKKVKPKVAKKGKKAPPPQNMESTVDEINLPLGERVKLEMARREKQRASAPTLRNIPYLAQLKKIANEEAGTLQFSPTPALRLKKIHKLKENFTDEVTKRYVLGEHGLKFFGPLNFHYGRPRPFATATHAAIAEMMKITQELEKLDMKARKELDEAKVKEVERQKKRLRRILKEYDELSRFMSAAEDFERKVDLIHENIVLQKNIKTEKQKLKNMASSTEFQERKSEKKKEETQKLIDETYENLFQLIKDLEINNKWPKPTASKKKNEQGITVVKRNDVENASKKISVHNFKDADDYAEVVVEFRFKFEDDDDDEIDIDDESKESKK